MSFLQSPWTTWVLALLIAAVALIRGKWSATLVIALLALALLGALLPPVGFIVAGVVLFYLIVVHGQELAQHLTKLFGGAP